MLIGSLPLASANTPSIRQCRCAPNTEVPAAVSTPVAVAEVFCSAVTGFRFKFPELYGITKMLVNKALTTDGFQSSQSVAKFEKFGLGAGGEPPILAELTPPCQLNNVAGVQS